MAYNYPIWVDVTSCIYNSGKSYGIKDTGEQKILVGSSAKNSHTLAEIITTKRINMETNEVIFTLSVDGVIVKKATFSEKKGLAKELIKIESFLKEKE